MAWLERWRAIAARIDGIIRSGEYVVSALQRNDADNFGIVRKWIAPELGYITSELRDFRSASATELPQAATNALDRFISQEWFTDKPELINTNLVAIAAFATFRTEFEYLVRDNETEGRNRSEIAFEHLRRMIAVDDQIKGKWNDAYDKGETACEQLGAVHLLSHGILAFKANGQKSATDLAFNEPFEDDTLVIRRSARAIVLTEWKLVRGSDESDKKAAEARKQTSEYASGILGDTELKSTRYIVIVSGRRLPQIQDVESEGVKFRHINIAVNPLSPSGEARVRTT